MKFLNPLFVVLVLSLFLLFNCQSTAPMAETPGQGGEVPSEEEEENGVDETDRTEEPRERPENAQDHSTEEHSLWVTPIAGPFHHPWGMAFLPEDRILVTERRGRLFLVDEDELTEIDGLPEVRATNQGGLLDIALHPDYEENNFVYLTYSKQEEGSNQTATAIFRARLEGTSLVDGEDIFVQNRYSGAGRHYGSRMVWLEDGTFLVSIGDRGQEPSRAQDTTDHAGSVLRLNDDGTTPDDNPFVGDSEVADEIYTFGNRNIQGMAVDPQTGIVWASDHGPRGGDIFYAVEAGNNYGWPIFTYGDDYRTGRPMSETITQDPDELEEVTAPFHRFDPSHPPSGLAVIRGGHFDRWEGDVLAGGLRTQEIRRLSLNEEGVSGEEAILSGEVGRIRDLRQGPDGRIYILPDSSEAMLYRFEAAP